MGTFAERLKIGIEKRNLSQAEAARKCGISQQSMNYIINNNLESSKLATQIASALGINPEWLIYGRGRFEETKVYELPIIHSPYMLKKFISQELSNDAMDYTVIGTYLGEAAFTYIFEPKKMVICTDNTISQDAKEYLTFDGDTVKITQTREKFSFPIFEWRIRHDSF